MVFKGGLTDVDRCLGIELEEGCEPSGMVIMAMGDHCKIDFRQINPQRCCIVSKKIPLPHIKQYPGAAVKLNVKAQPVLCSAGAAPADVIN